LLYFVRVVVFLVIFVLQNIMASVSGETGEVQIVPIVNRTLYTYSSVLHILCESFAVDTSGRDVRCETRLIAETHRLNQAGKMLAPVIDDAHLTNIDSLRKIRLLLRTFRRTPILSSSLSLRCSPTSI
jgi:hypothetical protein